MLRALEDFLVPAVDAAVPANVDVEQGPVFIDTAWPNNQRTVVVHARALEVLAPPPTEDDEAPAFLLETATWPTDGIADTFVLPGPIAGTIHEVEAPPGFPAVRGDDYQVDGDTIRFYRAPATGAPGVVAYVRTDDAHGYARRRRCAIELDIAAYAELLDDVDAFFPIALQVVLARLTRAPRLVLPPVPGVDVRVRMLDPRASIVSIERRRYEATEPPYAIARLRVEGQLDILVADGSPAPVSFIESLEGELQVDHADGEVPDPLAFTIGPEVPEGP